MPTSENQEYILKQPSYKIIPNQVKTTSKRFAITKTNAKVIERTGCIKKRRIVLLSKPIYFGRDTFVINIFANKYLGNNTFVETTKKLISNTTGSELELK